MIITEEEYEKYPFLKPRDGWYGATEIPQGWHDIVMIMCEEIKKFLNTYNIPVECYHCNQGKEKWGHLEWYDELDEFEDCKSPHIRSIIKIHLYNEVINHYRHVLSYTCTRCGKPGTVRRGQLWVEPICNNCLTKTINDPETITMA